ncbi:MAG TPA: hypothetical protein VLI39_01115 [Sedimentisphaerales bacterium]|nr:hypothetical protein [Sedimentisphaerales bacterium]
MSRQARVDSSAVLTEFRASLTTFASVAAVALDEATTDIQRSIQWLREDRHRYWKTQVQTRTAKYNQAKLALKTREVLDRAIAGTRSSCVEERRAVQIAEKRLRDAENRFRLTGMYCRQIERESLDYKGAVHGLLNALEVEIPNACAGLDRMVAALERYVAVAPPEMATAPREGFESTTVQPYDAPPGEDEGKPEPQEGKE